MTRHRLPFPALPLAAAFFVLPAAGGAQVLEDQPEPGRAVGSARATDDVAHGVPNEHPQQTQQTKSNSHELSAQGR